MLMPKVRTRFAPSPTGNLHIGSLRTALFAYLAARSQGGDFILRIEDTDDKRKVEGSEEKLIEILKWVGLEFDEGPGVGGKYGPYRQSERREIYDKYKDELLEKGEAYHCFCTPERLEEMRNKQQENKMPPRYDRACRNLSKEEVEKRIKAGERYVIRQKMPLEGTVVVKDELRGDISFKAEELEDHVLIKSDGMPTYQFANVVDDTLMEISIVIRGDEWIPTFPKNILLYKSFGWTPPKFLHLPVTLNKGGGKLSKRHGDVSVEDFRAKGYLVDTLINFCVLLGWRPKSDQEIFSLDELVKLFKTEDMGTSPAVFDLEKLDYLNGFYIRKMDLDELTKKCLPFITENFSLTKDKKKQTFDFAKKIIKLEQERLKRLMDIKEMSEFFFLDELEYDKELLIWKKLTAKDVVENLQTVHKLLERIPEEEWLSDSIGECLVSYINAKELKTGDYLWPMRVALTGQKASPGPFDVAEILGKEETLNRINKGVSKLI
jgi:glutamyl-tRNA synthetase